LVGFVLAVLLSKHIITKTVEHTISICNASQSETPGAGANITNSFIGIWALVTTHAGVIAVLEQSEL